MSLISLRKELNSLANRKDAEILQRFFKTGKGQYGEGDIFLGIRVPVQRKVANKYPDLPFTDIQELLDSKIHEYRLVGLFILIKQFKKSSDSAKAKIYKFYIKNAKRVNNWDLVDLSAPSIVGKYLLDKDRSILYKLVKSKNLWERRIAVLATFEFIRSKESADIFKLAKILLKDDQDLMHKATGWMLREVGNKMGVGEEEKFLKKYYQQMPRTMLRYAIEKFEESKRQKYLKGLI